MVLHAASLNYSVNGKDLNAAGPKSLSLKPHVHKDSSDRRLISLGFSVRTGRVFYTFISSMQLALHSWSRNSIGTKLTIILVNMFSSDAGIDQHTEMGTYAGALRCSRIQRRSSQTESHAAKIASH